MRASTLVVSTAVVALAFSLGCLGPPGGSGGGGGGGSSGGGAGLGGGGGASGGGGGAAGGGGMGGGGSFDAGFPAGDYTRTLPGWPSRSYDLVVPSGYDGGVGFPLVLALHGGGGNRAAQRKTECPGGVTSSPDCFDQLASARGFLVAYPDGTGATLAPNLRTWNSGGGANGWQCVSGYACNQNVDEYTYFHDLLADISSAVPVDLSRVYVTGFSNGASMAERLACQFPQNVSAFASVSGGNQYSTTQPCDSVVSVLEIHGTSDPCWAFDGGPASCADPNPGAKISVPATLAKWAANDGCDGGETLTAIPDVASDGTNTIRHAYSCAGAAVELYEVVDGGHAWPQGYSFSGGLGQMSQDFSANQAILDFFTAH